MKRFNFLILALLVRLMIPALAEEQEEVLIQKISAVEKEISLPRRAMFIPDQEAGEDMKWYEIKPSKAGSGKIVFQSSGRIIQTVMITVKKSAIAEKP